MREDEEWKVSPQISYKYMISVGISIQNTKKNILVPVSLTDCLDSAINSKSPILILSNNYSNSIFILFKIMVHVFTNLPWYLFSCVEFSLRQG